eukprot:3038337-Rhodomonas_salina.1
MGTWPTIDARPDQQTNEDLGRNRRKNTGAPRQKQATNRSSYAVAHDTSAAETGQNATKAKGMGKANAESKPQTTDGGSRQTLK